MIKYLEIIMDFLPLLISFIALFISVRFQKQEDKFESLQRIIQKNQYIEFQKLSDRVDRLASEINALLSDRGMASVALRSVEAEIAALRRTAGSRNTASSYQSDAIQSLLADIESLERRLDQLQGKNEMEPIVFMGLLGSIASIISFLQQNNLAVNPDTVLGQFRKRQFDPARVENKLGALVTDKDVIEQSDLLLRFQIAHGLFMDRIINKCINPFEEAIKDHALDDVEVDEAYGIASDCVCANITLARKSNGGKFPSDDFKELWKRFYCGK